MRLSFVFLLLISCLINLSGQENIQNPDTAFYHEKAMMIIPFEEKMFRSEIDKELAEESEKNYETILSNFRYGVAYQFRYEMLYRYKAFSLINMTVDSVREDLERIYAGVSYDYEVILDTAGYSGANPIQKIQFDKLIKESKKEPVNGSVNGEIVSTRDTRKRYMKTVVKDTSLLPYLNDRYECEYYLFINELDLLNDLSDINSVSTGEWNRILKIHFTIIDSNGKVIETGLLEKSFPRDQNNIDEIINTEIKELARQLRYKMANHERMQAMIIKEKQESMNELNPVKKKIISAKKRFKKN